VDGESWQDMALGHSHNPSYDFCILVLYLLEAATVESKDNAKRYRKWECTDEGNITSHRKRRRRLTENATRLWIGHRIFMSIEDMAILLSSIAAVPAWKV
jgi:hypothetical protein